MKKISIYLMVMGFILGLAIPSFAMYQAVKIQQNDVVGKYLTDTEGITLYWFKNDEPGESNCAGNCIMKWPGFYREKVAAPDGIAMEDGSEPLPGMMGKNRQPSGVILLITGLTT